MDKLQKLNSLNCWFSDEGIYPCDMNGLPILEDIIYFDELKPEWFQNLSLEDKEKISNLLQNKNKFNGN